MSIHDPVFRIGVLAVHPFGLFVAIGIVLGYAMALWQTLRAGLPARYLPGLLVVVVLGSFIVARAGYVIQHPGASPDGAQSFLALWQGGLSLEAGVVGGALLLALYTWSRREPLWQWGDALAPAAALGLAVGMLGSPFDTPPEGWGRPTNGPFFMRVDPSVLPADLVNERRFQPIFAYEAILFGILALVLLVMAWRQRRNQQADGATGVIGLTFLIVTAIGYGLMRPITLDASDPALVAQTQGLCAVVAAIAIGLLVSRLWRSRRDEEVTREIERFQLASAQPFRGPGGFYEEERDEHVTHSVGR